MSTDSRRLGKYEFRERLGRGGMAEVWKAIDTQLQRYVAIKLMHPDLQNDPTFMTRFLREARTMASLRHPNIVQIHDFQIAAPPEFDQTMAYMVMDYIEGPTLADYIHNTSSVGQFPAANDIIHLSASIGSAVDYAHQRGMLHRDIKPANILLDTHGTAESGMGTPMLTDFGIATLLGATNSVMSSSWLGTLIYAAPEQMQGLTGNECSDIYSLGVILYEICTGMLPFQNTDPTKMMSQHLSETPRLPEALNPHISPALSAVIMRSLSKDPAQRFPSASALTAALVDAFHVSQPDSFSTTASPTGAISPVSPISYQTESLVGPNVGNSPIAPLPMLTSTSGQNVGMPTPVPTPHSLPSQVASTPILPQPVVPQVRPLQAPPAAVAPPIPSAPTKRKRRRLLVALIALLVVVLLGGSAGGLFLLLHQHSIGAATLPPMQGSAFFVSSGQISDESNQGIEDQFQIALQNVPDAPSGKSYYAWLLSDSQDQNSPPCHSKPLPLQALLLGKLPVVSGNVNFLYQGDAVHTSLFTNYSRVLITVDTAQGTPALPSSDHRSWTYYAEFPQAFGKITPCHSALYLLRRVLSQGRDLAVMGIYGGLNAHLFRNAQKILEWANSARGAWNGSTSGTQLIKRQVIALLYILDSVYYVHKDVPQIPAQSSKDNRFDLFPMVHLDGITKVMNDSFMNRIDSQLKNVNRSPGVPPATQMTVTNADLALKNLQTWFLQVHQDAKQLFMMNGQQLKQESTLTLLNDMHTNANYAFIGQLDPSTGSLQLGASQIFNGLQQLASFNVQPYKA